MYPNLYYFFKDVFGIELSFLKLINSFGFFVALAFIAAAITLTNELRRKERLNLLSYSEVETKVGNGASWKDIIWNAILGFLIGFKIVGIFLNRETAMVDPQEYILSLQGNLPAGILIAFALAALKFWQGRKEKLKVPEKRVIRIWPHDRVGDMIILAAVFGFAGAKLFHNLENWDDFIKNPLAALSSFSGLTFYGGLICAAIAILIFAKKHRIGMWHLLDSFGPALMIAYAVGRMGCHVSGDGDWGILNSAYVTSIQGKSVPVDSTTYKEAVIKNIQYYQETFKGVKQIVQPSDVMHLSIAAPPWLPNWMVAYPYPHNVVNEGVRISDCEGRYCSVLPVPVYPTPFYETIICLLLFFILWAIRKKIKIAGVLFSIYLIFNGLERFFIEKIRVNTHYNILGIHPTQAEIISSFLILGGISMFIYRRKQRVVNEL